MITELTKTSQFRLKLYVKNFGQSKIFYQQTLGYRIIKEWDRDKHDQGVMFATGSGIIELLTPDAAYQKIQGADISLEVADVWQLWDQLKGEQSIRFALCDNAWGDSSFCIADPDGFSVTFFTPMNK